MPSSARISLADLADATGITPSALAAEVATLQRASRFVVVPHPKRPRDRGAPPATPADDPGGATPEEARDARGRRAA
jgi:hypothetical protein